MLRFALFAGALLLVVPACMVGPGGDDDTTGNPDGSNGGSADADPSAPDADPNAPDADPSAPDAAGGDNIDATVSNAEPVALMGITARHNEYRSAVGVADLVWDPALAQIAQAWVEQCQDNDGNGLVDHNPNRSDTYPGYVGENNYATSANTPSPIAAVDLWASEMADYNPSTGTCNVQGGCGHYTQVVWSTTTKIGCGVYTCSNLQYRGSIVCDYAPGGNTGGPAY